ncbi:predicted protein [Chaetoceros tenuissimus]|uniref:Protein RFT1 homolog n=1 Tax=Chaetoceros tenuissimus TaxID=426638 RepID=A0AAD3D3H5_9STRA|nr:predicted protein [Chaetoceros tenuissimus]
MFLKASLNLQLLFISNVSRSIHAFTPSNFGVQSRPLIKNKVLSSAVPNSNVDEAIVWQDENNSKSATKRIIDGFKVAPYIATLPLYGLGFGIFGPKQMWSLSKWIYGQANSSEQFLHAHFGRITKYIYSDKDCAQRRLVSYKIHPLFASLSLMSTALLAFAKGSSAVKVVSYNRLLIINMINCFISTIAAIPLLETMMGSPHAKKWLLIQGKAFMSFAALALCPGQFGRLMVHMNWSILFAAGAIERFYVLCILSQLHISDRKSYVKYYSPQFEVTTLGSLPLGILSFILFG